MTYKEILKQCAKDLWDLTNVGKAEGLNDKKVQLDLNKAVIEFALEKLEDANNDD